MLVNARNPQDRHPALEPLGSVRVETRVVKPTYLTCQAERPYRQEQRVFVQGQLVGFQGYVDPQIPLKIMIEGVGPGHRFLTSTLKLVTASPNGSFTGYLPTSSQIALAREVICLFAGTTQLSSSSSGYVPVQDNRIFLPLVLRAWNYQPPATLILTPVADAYIRSDTPTINYRSATTLYAGTEFVTKTARSLYQFNLSLIPAGATIESAQFRVLLTTTSLPTPTLNLELKRVNTAWSESAVNWVTPLTYISTNNVLGVGTTLMTWYSWDVTGWVQAWINGTPNHGLALVSRNEARIGYRGFASREAPPNWPRLVITYRP